jgi:DNA-binding CsgD family transcriptional regulator/PAS domain-containing protein
MQDVVARTLETLGLLYSTTFGVEQWPRALDAIAELIGGNGALLFVRDEGPEELQISATSTRYLPQDIDTYLNSLAKGEEYRWVRVLDELPPRTIQTDVDIWPDRSVYDAMPSVRFLKSLQLYGRVAVRPCAHGGWKDALTLLFDEVHGGIRPEEAERLALLVPHVARAIEVQRPFQLLMRRFAGVLAALDRLGIGVVIVRADGEVVVTNHEADRILLASDGAARNGRSRITAVDPDADARLRAAIARVGRAARLEERGATVTIELPRRSGSDPYLVDVAPLRDDGAEMGSAFSGVLLTVIDPEHREMVSIQGLARSYGLTPVETIVCRMLAQGLTLREIAESRGVSLDTIKSQSRAIYGKTHTRNRRELVRRALSIVPPLLDRDGKRIN